ncbi:AAA-like domain-containing protein, partial [Calothrix parietina]
KFFNESVNSIDTYVHSKIESSLNLLQKGKEEVAVGNLFLPHQNDYHSYKLYILFSGSPLALELPEFTHEQVKDLAQRHQLNWNDTEINNLTQLVGGHPFLVRLALFQIANREINLAQFLQTAPTAAGIYSKHLQRQEYILQQQPELGKAMQEIVGNSHPVNLTTEVRFKLYSLGLVKLQNDQVTPRCELYRQYFRTSIKDNHKTI